VERASLIARSPRATSPELVCNGDDLLIGAALSAPSWVSGPSDNDLKLLRFNWQKKNHDGDLDRLERLGKAIADAQRAGSLAMTFVDSLTDAEMIATSEQTERAANAAVAAVKMQSSAGPTAILLRARGRRSGGAAQAGLLVGVGPPAASRRLQEPGRARLAQDVRDERGAGA
jgi:hypothetical protein